MSAHENTDSPQPTSDFMLQSQNTSDTLREEALNHANTMIRSLVESIEHLNTLRKPEELSPMEIENVRLKSLSLLAKLIEIRQQFVVETDKSNDILKRFLFWGLDRKE